MSRSPIAAALTLLVLLALTLAPVKYLTIDVGGADLTGFRLALLAALMVSAVLAVLDPAHRRSIVRVLRTRYFLAATALTAWISIAGVRGLLDAPTDTLERRAIIGTGSLVLTVLVLPLVALPVLLRLRLPERLVVPARVWQALLAFAFVQVGLHLVGVPVNGIEPGIPSTYPVAPVFGVNLLRPYSFLGEPRELASIAIPVLVAGVVLTGKSRLTLRHGVALGVLGVLLASYTFYLALVGFAVYYLLFERRSGLIELRAAVAAVALVVAVPLVSTAVSNDGTRVLQELDDITAKPTPAEPFGPPGSPEPEPEAPTTYAFVQAPDLLADDYARDALAGDVGASDLLFGSGIGSFTTTINRYYVKQFGYDLVRGGQLVNSRLFPFGFLVEAGLLGLVLLAWLLLEGLLAVQRSVLPPAQRARVRILGFGFVLASMVQVSILFGVGLVLALALSWRAETAAPDA